MRLFWQELILSLVGPLSVAVIGTFLFGLWAAWITKRWQERKEDAALRESLIRELLEVSSALYLALRHYEHLVDYPESWRDMPHEREALDGVYVRTRTAGDAIEYRLMAYFASEDLARKWHSMMDLLTTRYFQLVGSPPGSYLKALEGPRHTTLSSAELAAPERIFERYKEFAQQVPLLILNTRRRVGKVAHRDAVGDLETALSGKTGSERHERASDRSSQ
jgi:hypothetical protein